jgi:hypothetical protein
MFTKTFIYSFLIGLAGIAGLVLIINAFIKSEKKRLISGKLSFILGIIFLLIFIITGINLTRQVYTKIKTAVTALQNFPETVGTEPGGDSTDYVRVLKTYEPEKYKWKVPKEYYYYYSFRDWWRYPLVYPYSIYSIDVLETGVLANDSSKMNSWERGSPDLITHPFYSFIFDKNYLIGSVLPDTNKIDVMIKALPEYFIFDFRNEKSETIMGETYMKKKLDEINFTGDRKFITIREYSEKF